MTPPNDGCLAFRAPRSKAATPSRPVGRPPGELNAEVLAVVTKLDPAKKWTAPNIYKKCLVAFEIGQSNFYRILKKLVECGQVIENREVVGPATYCVAEDEPVLEDGIELAE